MDNAAVNGFFDEAKQDINRISDILEFELSSNYRNAGWFKTSNKRSLRTEALELRKALRNFQFNQMYLNYDTGHKILHYVTFLTFDFLWGQIIT